MSSHCPRVRAEVELKRPADLGGSVRVGAICRSSFTPVSLSQPAASQLGPLQNFFFLHFYWESSVRTARTFIAAAINMH